MRDDFATAGATVLLVWGEALDAVEVVVKEGVIPLTLGAGPGVERIG